MLLLRCTKKLQTAIGLKKSALLEGVVDDSVFESWHANLIELCGSQGILVAHDKTLFNFLIADVPVHNAQQFIETFKSYLRCCLVEEGFDTVLIDKLLDRYSDCQFATTNSKRVLGSLNELAFMYGYHVEDAGSVHSYMVPEIIKKMNRVPMGMLNGKYAIDAFRESFGPNS